MRLSLYLKFILAYIIFGVAGFVAIATISSQLTYSYLVESRSQTLYDEANLIASTYSTVYEGQNISLEESYPQLRAVATFLNAKIWVMNKNGKIIVDAENKRVSDVISDFDPTATGNKSYMVGRYFNSFDEDYLSVSAPITGNFRTYGYVVIHLPMKNVTQSQYHILNIVYITSLIVFLLSMIILIVFQRIVYSPLKKITDGAKAYAEGDLKYEIKVNSNDEMGYLAATLNYMSDKLDDTENYQKKFISNVSHDFRSPLTSIKGYLEAILDGTIPPEMLEKYLNRVIDETKRLTKLTESILSLDSIESVKLNKTSFDINEMIRNTASSFEVQCNSKNITIELIFINVSQYVFADFGKIEQVLYNLIDNAIKFSSQNSSITIQTSIKKEKIFVSVKDTGIGIAKNEQSKVFDRFYKSDLSRGKDKKGTGLGLAIVKEILQTHGENIDVISTVGIGTEFIFSLPISKEI